MRILLTNATLSGRSGTETVTRDLALGHLRNGHHPAVYTRRSGPIAQELSAAGVPIFYEIDALASERFDVIHGHHLAVCAAPLALFDDTPAISVCHDSTAWHDFPIFAPSIRAYAGVSKIIVDQLVQHGVAAHAAHLINNGVDLERFRPGRPAPTRPRRALAFAKNFEHVEGIRAACAEREVEVDFIGSAVGNIVDAPERLLPDYDLVFASAQSAQEALVCARPVIAVDGRGLAGWVDMSRYESWRPHNFGLASFSKRPTSENILAELDRYDPLEAGRVGERARDELGLHRTLANYEALYQQAIGADAPPLASPHAWARHLEAWSPRMTTEWPWLQEHVRLAAAAERAAAGLEIAPLDVALTFGAAGTAAPYVALVGFSRAEAWGVWSTAPSASLRLRAPPAPAGLHLDLAFGFLAGGAGIPIDISILANGEPLDRWSERGDAQWIPCHRTLTLPSAFCGQMLWLTIKLVRPEGAEAGKSATAVALNSVRLRPI